jgi:hypothetical protein
MLTDSSQYGWLIALTIAMVQGRPRPASDYELGSF